MYEFHWYAQLKHKQCNIALWRFNVKKGPTFDRLRGDKKIFRISSDFEEFKKVLKIFKETVSIIIM